MATKKAKRGRPVGSGTGIKQDAVVRFRCSSGLVALIEQSAKRHSLDVSEWLRRAARQSVLSGPGAVPPFADED